MSMIRHDCRDEAIACSQESAIVYLSNTSLRVLRVLDPRTTLWPLGAVEEQSSRSVAIGSCWIAIELVRSMERTSAHNTVRVILKFAYVKLDTSESRVMVRLQAYVRFAVEIRVSSRFSRSESIRAESSFRPGLDWRQ